MLDTHSTVHTPHPVHNELGKRLAFYMTVADQGQGMGLQDSQYLAYFCSLEL